MRDNIRKAAIAGSWYPGVPEVLRQEINSFFAHVPDDPPCGRIIGLLAPHAGYQYSGQVAAFAYRFIRGASYEAVIVLGPSHRASFRGVSVYDDGGYETPLGVVPVDRELARRIMSHSSVVSSVPAAHAFEHSIEIQLPFIQVALGGFRFVPLLMGEQDRKTCEELAQAIVKSVAGHSVLIVGSSDLSHFHSAEKAAGLDGVVLAAVENMEPHALLRELQVRSCEACGGGPLAVTMMASRQLGADASRILKYADSGDITGDKSNVVGYAAALFFAGSAASEQEQGGGSGGMRGSGEVGLTEQERQALLTLARRTIESRLNDADSPELADDYEKLREKRGAFETLKKYGQLGGCIGYIEAVSPLSMTIKQMAVAAAFHDPRFKPIHQSELNDLTLEISVLSPLREITDINEIEVGRHGLYIVKGVYSGLLLPQVATEYRWDRMTFLRETCRKAGLPPKAWQEKDVQIFIFSAEVFGEK
jgi:MEMO1 family protein